MKFIGKHRELGNLESAYKNDNFIKINTFFTLSYYHQLNDISTRVKKT